MPFGTYEPGSNTETLNYFINDRNSLKGGLYEEQAADNYMIYWVKIYSLQVSKLVMSDDPRDEEKEFSFTVQLSGEVGQTLAEDFNGIYGDMTFTGGTCSFKLKSGESITAEKLPLGYSYTVTENLSSEEQLYYTTTPGLTQTGKMNVETRYLYEVSFINMHAICKITDATEGLLYYKRDGELRPAVYSQLQNAFNALANTTFYNEAGTVVIPAAARTPTSCACSVLPFWRRISPSRMSSPGCTTFSPVAADFETASMLPPKTSQYSTITTASAPRGTSPPVGVYTQLPAPASSSEESSPSLTSPAICRMVGIMSEAAPRSALLTA